MQQAWEHIHWCLYSWKKHKCCKIAVSELPPAPHWYQGRLNQFSMITMSKGPFWCCGEQQIRRNCRDLSWQKKLTASMTLTSWWQKVQICECGQVSSRSVSHIWVMTALESLSLPTELPLSEFRGDITLLKFSGNNLFDEANHITWKQVLLPKLPMPTEMLHLM